MADIAAVDPELDELLGVSDDENVESKPHKEELDALLGGSDDGYEESKDQNKNDELNDLLGGSDDEVEDSTVKSKLETEKVIRSNELDQILGKVVDSKTSSKELKEKTQSTINISTSYRVPAQHQAVFVRTPNFIKIQTAEYDEVEYDDKAERVTFDGSTAVIRWRLKRDQDGRVVMDANGNPVKESNARVIQWADGSRQLVVGDAVFQCKNVDIDNW